MHRAAFAAAGTGAAALILSSSPFVIQAVPQPSASSACRGPLFVPNTGCTAGECNYTPTVPPTQEAAVDRSRTWESVLFCGENNNSNNNNNNNKNGRTMASMLLLNKFSGGASGNSGRRPSPSGNRSGKRRPSPVQEGSFEFDDEDEDEDEDEEEAEEYGVRDTGGRRRAGESYYDDGYGAEYDDEEDDLYDEEEDDDSGEYDDEDDDFFGGDSYGESEDMYAEGAGRESRASRQGAGRGGKGPSGGRGRGRGRGRGGGRRPAAVVAPRMQRIKERLFDAKAELRTKMSGVTHKGAKVIRELKGSLSSDLEKTLIKATRPDNEPAKRKHVNLLMQAAEHAFPVYMIPKDESMAYWKEGPYWMTLHKLWRRMAEKDYRTAAKALYVLHRLARGTTTESWGYFRITLAEMRREEDKGTKSRYFSRRVISNVDDDGRPYSAWLDKYANFALLRMQTFAPDLSELATVGAETSHEEASRALEKAEKLIEAALACELGPDLDNDVTCDCLKLVIEDLCELWSLFQQKLEVRLQQRFAEGGFLHSELRRTLSFLEFYLEHLTPARLLVEESHQMLAVYSHAVPKGLGDALATDMLQEQVAWIQEELTEQAKASVGKSLNEDDGDDGKGSDRTPTKSGASTTASSRQQQQPRASKPRLTPTKSRSSKSRSSSQQTDVAATSTVSAVQKTTKSTTTSVNATAANNPSRHPSTASTSAKRRKLNKGVPAVGGRESSLASATAATPVGSGSSTISGKSGGGVGGAGGEAASDAVSGSAAHAKKSSSSSTTMKKKKSSKTRSSASNRRGE